MNARYLLPLSFAILTACLPLMIWGAQVGHDHAFQLVRSQAFGAQLFEGELYPRWLIDMNAGAGGPTFYFYPPVSFHLASVGIAIAPGASAAVQLAIGESLIILLSGLAFFWFARSLARPGVAAATALIYALGPYHFGIDLLERQALAEAASFIWMPLAFGFLERIVEGRRGLTGYAIAYALLVLTHLPTALLSSIMLLVYIAVRRAPRRGWIRFIAGTTLGLLLASIYLLPALLTQHQVSMEGMVQGWYRYDRWFLLDGIAAPDPGFESRLLAVAAALGAGFLLAVPFAWRGDPRARAWTAIVVVAGLCMTPLTAWIWGGAPLLQRVQFPWRFLALLEFAVVATLACALRHRWSIAAALVVAAAALVAGVVGYRPHRAAAADPGRPAQLAAILAGSMDQADFLPAGCQLEPARVELEIGPLERVSGPARILVWRPREIVLEVDSAGPAQVDVRQFHYSGWRAIQEPGGEPIPVRMSEPRGLIRLSAPAGHYRIRLRLRAPPVERAGGILSMVGLLLLIALLVRQNLAAPASAVHSPASTGPDPERPASPPPGGR